MRKTLASAAGFELTTRSTAVGGPRWRPGHVHDDFELSYVEDGTLEFQTALGAHAARVGECIVMLPDLENSPRLSGRLTQLHLSREQLLAAEDALGLAAPKAIRRFDPGATTTRLMSLLARSARELPQDDPELGALVNAISLSLVPRAAAPERGGPDPHIRAALDFIRCNLREPIGVDDMARAAGLSRFVFLRRFKAQTGSTPYQYLLDQRLDSARELLARGEHSVLSVALELEFKDPGRFSRAFRERFGFAPSKLRRS